MKHEITIGLNDRSTHTQKISVKKAIAIIAAEVGNCTVFQATGVWNGEIEKTLRLEIYSPKNGKKRLIEAARRLCIKLNQDAIIVDGTFVNHPENA